MNEIAANHLVELLEKKDFKKVLLKKLNDNIDIPIINEKTEKKVLDKVYEVLVDALKSVI
tara:strand:- start:165 stop:344 length:180 start_codon:yes stop_codon:yes gene_type:complete